MKEQVQLFQENLEEFARKHKRDINKNAEFRKHFHEMCTSIGVDPLQSTKGFWAQMLGIGPFYYELSVQIIDVCIRTRASNGGMITVPDVLERLQSRRAKSADPISADDIERAIHSSKVLGGGFDLVKVGATKMIRSVPLELNRDHEVVIAIAERKGSVSVSDLLSGEHWSRERMNLVMAYLLREGLCWVDKKAPDGQAVFYFPSFLPGLSLSAS
mmetsp:Transcript_32144/g.80686  ORF Transcript_32144/g.80686 Transcript_32144/m.80686 type:complete len:215 (-) Transcript_32144:56-700(-)|eukprot:CAMPEP_0177629066 /NCGR_PEP_ID=MMETSP0447-20121125/467_1 /TAXON_ID=0 /ORGANISM="Stygamoeba regulata, Strain BSH-02190019" /LENGTH=214 /DNA_ID=CAMNT_0019130357 /DNA_START=429 /DNA_END=1073 /DNA_ORIENTATION=-